MNKAELNEITEIIRFEFKQQEKKIDQKFKKQDEKIVQELKKHEEIMNQKFKEQDEIIDQRFKEQDEIIDQRFKEQDEKINKMFKEQEKEIHQRFKEQDEKIIKEISNQMLVFEEHYGRSLTIAVEGLNHKNSNVDIQSKRIDILENSNNLNSSYVYNHEKRIHNLEKAVKKLSK